MVDDGLMAVNLFVHHDR